MADTIKKGKYRVFNGSGYDTVHLETSATQVIETSDKLFASQAEKNSWNSKASGNHNHDNAYAAKNNTYTKSEVDTKLSTKAELSHGHLASDITTDTNKMFVSKTEKDRWNNTYTKGEIDQSFLDVSDDLDALDTANSTAHDSIIKGYQTADSTLSGKISKVAEDLESAKQDLTDLINNGGTANEALDRRVDTLENVTIPEIKRNVSTLTSNVNSKFQDIEDNYATKQHVSDELATYDQSVVTKLNGKVDKTTYSSDMAKKANADDVYTKTETNNLLAAKVDTSTYTTDLAKKVDKSTYNNDMAKKANQSEVDELKTGKVDVSTFESAMTGKANLSHKHTLSDISNAGTAASKNVGTSSGQIPILDAEGKLSISVLPSIAVNEKFEANSESAALALVMEIGDILFLTENSVVSTYICINDKASTFSDKFRALESKGDVITKAEVETALGKKLDKSIYESDKATLNDTIALKADAADVYDKTAMDIKLNGKVDKVSGKGLSTNDFTAAYKSKLDGIASGANNYAHPTGDGNMHVPATGTTSNKKVLMAGSTAGALAWTSLTADHITQTTTKKFVSQSQIDAWDAKAEGSHTHDQYRLISDSYTKSQTDAAIHKLATVISSTQPASGTQSTGAVWIEETT